MKTKDKVRHVNIVGFIIVLAVVFFFIKEQYWQAFFSIGLLVVLLKLDTLKKLILSPKSGLEAEFEIPKEKIEKDIKENDKPVTKKTFAKFKTIEERILRDVQQKIGGEMKKQIYFVYGEPNNPEFVYTPDATIQTETELIFLEIKYVANPELAKKIISKTSSYLKTVLEKFSPSSGKKLVIKLIVASERDLDIKTFKVPVGIELEFYKL